MGMFDYIRCRMPLPQEPAPPACEWFQTKDVPTGHLWLDRWTIEADGRLIRHAYRIEDRSDPNAEPGSIESLRGCMTRVYEPENDAAVPFHGDIEFGHYDDKTGEYWDYTARFTEGVCVCVWLSEHSPPTKDTNP